MMRTPAQLGLEPIRAFFGKISRRTGVLVCVAVAGAGVVSRAADRSTRDGVYSAGQAERGKTGYRTECARCHALDLVGTESGPPLVGANFLKLNGNTLADLFETLRTTMPQDSPGRLTARQYVDLVAYLLQANDCPSGADELPSDVEALRTVTVAGCPR
jgi:mono/diheme cytochrome c family protein